MPEKTITATKVVNGVEKVASIPYDFGTAETSGDMFGKEVVHSNFVAKATITCQAAMRRMLEKGKTAEEIAAVMKGWKPGVALERVVDPVAAIEARMDSMSDAEADALIKRLRERAKAKKAG